MFALLLLSTFTAGTDRSPVVRHTFDRLEINSVVDEVGAEQFAMLICWRGDEIDYVHFWGPVGGVPFGRVLSEKPGNIRIAINHKGPRLLDAPVLIRSATRESVELVHARKHGRRRRGLSTYGE